MIASTISTGWVFAGVSPLKIATNLAGNWKHVCVKEANPDGFMSMECDQDSQPLTPLADRVGKGADALAVAEAVVDVWRDIDVALRPIIGQGGVVALFRRSVHLTAAVYPWLVSDGQEPVAGLDLEVLKSSLASQSVAQALACGDRLLLTFHQLLASLIGVSLAERLLRPVWGPSSRKTLQDPSS